MPKKLKKMVKSMEKQGMDKPKAYAIATSVLQKKGLMKIAKKGK
jgi:hypothetical protein